VEAPRLASGVQHPGEANGRRDQHDHQKPATLAMRTRWGRTDPPIRVA
jgi:hypothetical protein